MTRADFDMVDMMRRQNARYENVDLISQAYNIRTQQTEVLVRTDAQTAKLLRAFAPDSRSVGSNPWQTPQLHHIFPDKQKDFFATEAKINIDDFTVMLDATSHRKISHDWMTAWDTFEEGYWRLKASRDVHPSEARQLAIRYAGDLMTKFGLGGATVAAYRGHPEKMK